MTVEDPVEVPHQRRRHARTGQRAFEFIQEVALQILDLVEWQGFALQGLLGGQQ